MNQNNSKTQNETYTDLSILNEFEEYVYVARCADYKLLFANDALRSIVPHVCEPGKKCYEAFYHLDKPCVFCEMRDETSHDVVVNKKKCAWNDKILERKTRMINYQGDSCFLQVAFDISPLEDQKNELDNALSFEKVMNDATKIFFSYKSKEVAFPQALEMVGQFLGASRVYLFETKGSKALFQYEWEDETSLVRDNLEFPNQVVSKWQKEFEIHQSIYVNSVEQQLSHDTFEYIFMKRNHIESYLEAPLFVDDSLYGFIGIDNPPHEKMKNAQLLLMNFAYYLSSVLSNEKKTKILEKQSYIDSMTDVMNRNAFHQDIDNHEFLPNDLKSVGVAFFDLNGLKVLNDTKGHHAGDDLIHSFASVLMQFYPQRKVYRIGGDEFVVICYEIPQEKFELKNKEIMEYIDKNTNISVSLGEAWSDRDDRVRKVVAKADQRMYENKQNYYRNLTNEAFENHF